MAEFEGLHRCESSGSTHGLLRVRQMAQDDAHIFCTDDQIVPESKDFVDLLNSMYADLGVELHSVKLALRPEKRFGTDEQWTIAEDKLEQAANAAGVQVERLPNEGAFYGPKLEFHLRDAIGRTWQCGTLQLDYVLPERLGRLLYRRGRREAPAGDAAPRDLRLDGAVHRRADRALCRRVPALARAGAGGGRDHHVGRRSLMRAQVVNKLKAAGLRVELDLRNEKINYKVREHSLAKVPVIVVVGRREAENGQVALRRLGGETQQVMSLDEAVATLETRGATRRTWRASPHESGRARMSTSALAYDKFSRAGAVTAAFFAALPLATLSGATVAGPLRSPWRAWRPRPGGVCQGLVWRRVCRC